MDLLWPKQGTRQNVMSLFLFYEDQHALRLKGILEELSVELKEMGAELRAAEFKDLSSV
jgi:hypothetical protein